MTEQAGRIARPKVHASPTRALQSLVALGLVSAGIAWGSLARATSGRAEDQRQWHALGVRSFASGAGTGLPMSASPLAQPTDFVPHRDLHLQQVHPSAAAPSHDPGRQTQVRIRGHVGDGLYWSLRAAGASPDAAAQYLAALATQIDVGEVAAGDAFDMVLGSSGELLYAGLEPVGSSAIQLVRWTTAGQKQWINAANAGTSPEPSPAFAVPAQGPITSYFGYRYHPILHFTRFHAGIDIAASSGSPIVAAGDGRIIVAGWSGGFGNEVAIAHAGGMTSIYGHMSRIVAQPGSIVRAGELIGYVGSSGLSTGPHLHFEVRHGDEPVNPLSVRFAAAPMKDAQVSEAVKLRLKSLLGGSGTGD